MILESAEKMFPVTEHDILKVTAAYLKYAPDRIGGGVRKKARAENDGAEVINGAENWHLYISKYHIKFVESLRFIQLLFCLDTYFKCKS